MQRNGRGGWRGVGWGGVTRGGWRGGSRREGRMGAGRGPRRGGEGRRGEARGGEGRGGESVEGARGGVGARRRRWVRRGWLGMGAETRRYAFGSGTRGPDVYL